MRGPLERDSELQCGCDSCESLRLDLGLKTTLTVIGCCWYGGEEHCVDNSTNHLLTVM